MKTMEESESGITLQELSNARGGHFDQDEAKKKEAKAEEEKEKKGTLISISYKPY